MDTCRRLRRRARHFLWLGGKVEGNAEDVGVFGIEQSVVIQLIGLAAQASTNHLLAEELRSECADAKDVGEAMRVLLETVVARVNRPFRVPQSWPTPENWGWAA